MMYCTTCSASKDEQEGKLPAIERYKSYRIQDVYQKSLQAGVDFRIFSGKYGLIEPDHQIPYYNKALMHEEVVGIQPLLVEQLREFPKGTVHLFICPTAKDPGITPYIKAMELACATSNTELIIHADYDLE